MGPLFDSGRPILDSVSFFFLASYSLKSLLFGTPQDYQRMLDLMRDIILATDLAHHLRIFKDLQKMAEGNVNLVPFLGTT